ncbi:transcriptional repressor, partial [Lactococcus lactis]
MEAARKASGLNITGYKVEIYGVED